MAKHYPKPYGRRQTPEQFDRSVLKQLRYLRKRKKKSVKE